MNVMKKKTFTSCERVVLTTAKKCFVFIFLSTLLLFFFMTLLYLKEHVFLSGYAWTVRNGSVIFAKEL